MMGMMERMQKVTEILQRVVGVLDSPFLHQPGGVFLFLILQQIVAVLYSPDNKTDTTVSYTIDS